MLDEIRLVLVRPSGWECMGGWSWVHARCWVLRDRAGCFFGGMLDLDSLGLFLMLGCVGEGYCPYFENYTVDASILDAGAFAGFRVDKIWRAAAFRGWCSSIIGSATFRVVVS